MPPATAPIDSTPQASHALPVPPPPPLPEGPHCAAPVAEAPPVYSSLPSQGTCLPLVFSPTSLDPVAPVHTPPPNILTSPLAHPALSVSSSEDGSSPPPPPLPPPALPPDLPPPVAPLASTQATGSSLGANVPHPAVPLGLPLSSLPLHTPPSTLPRGIKRLSQSSEVPAAPAMDMDEDSVRVDSPSPLPHPAAAPSPTPPCQQAASHPTLPPSTPKADVTSLAPIPRGPLSTSAMHSLPVYGFLILLTRQGSLTLTGIFSPLVFHPRCSSLGRLFLSCGTYAFASVN